MKVWVLISLLGYLGCTTAGTLISTPPPSNDGVLTICPGVPLSITCSHNNTASRITRWMITGTTHNCERTVSHGVNPMDDSCGPFNIVMISDNTRSGFTSTAQLSSLPETLNGATVACFDAGFGGEVGTITLQVVDPTPSTNSVEYSVDSDVSGSLTISVTSLGAYSTGVTYSGSVDGGTVDVDGTGNVLTVTGLNYTQSHIVNINGSSNVCSGLQRSSQFSYTFTIAKLTISQLTLSIQCSNVFLPVTLTWTVDQGILSSPDTTASLNPLMIGMPAIRYSSVNGDFGPARSNSPYTLSNITVGDIYNFTVSVTNVAGVTPQPTSPLRVSAFTVDTSTVTSQGCLTITVSEDCAESISSGDFAILLSYGVGSCQSVTDFPNPTNTTETINSSSGVCIPVGTMSIVQLCYAATLMYQNTPIMSQTNLDFQGCEVSVLEAELLSQGSGVTVTTDINGTVPHATIAKLGCGFGEMISEDDQVLCVNSVWTVGETNSCLPAVWVIVLIIILAIVVIVVVVIIVLVLYLKLKNKEGSSKPLDAESDGLTKTLPPPDSLYADPNTIEHEAAPGTEDQYAMVDRKVKKNTKPKPTPPEALYQDPNTIEHETAASGDTYAVVDKPKRSSKKKGGPDVVPPASEGLTYADIDLSSKRPKPGSGRQAPQQPGEYPKEHPVEYSSVDHGNTSQL